MSSKNDIVTALKKRDSNSTINTINKVLGSLNTANKYRNGGKVNSIKTVSPNDIPVLDVDAKPRVREDIPFEELQKTAKSDAENYYNELVKESDAKTAPKMEKIEKQLEENATEAERDILNAGADYRRNLESINETAIRNGMSDSSVYSLLKRGAEAEFAEQTAYIREKMELNQRVLESQREALEQSREMALRDFELKKAEEYERRLKELYEEEAKARQAVKEYNERLEKFMREYEKNRARTQQEWADAINNGLI